VTPEPARRCCTSTSSSYRRPREPGLELRDEAEEASVAYLEAVARPSR
jgi:hypothetical protein